MKGFHANLRNKQVDEGKGETPSSKRQDNIPKTSPISKKKKITTIKQKKRKRRFPGYVDLAEDLMQEREIRTERSGLVVANIVKRKGSIKS